MYIYAYNPEYHNVRININIVRLDFPIQNVLDYNT